MAICRRLPEGGTSDKGTSRRESLAHIALFRNRFMLAKLPFEELNAKMDSYSGRPPECCSLYVNIEACLAFVYDIVYDGHTFIEL